MRRQQYSRPTLFCSAESALRLSGCVGEVDEVTPEPLSLGRRQLSQDAPEPAERAPQTDAAPVVAIGLNHVRRPFGSESTRG